MEISNETKGKEIALLTLFPYIEALERSADGNGLVVPRFLIR